MTGHGSPPPPDRAAHPNRRVYSQTWEHEGSHYAGVEIERFGRSGTTEVSWSAGPFKTHLRADVAARSLSQRVAAGKGGTKRYHQSTYHERHDSGWDD